MYDQAVVETQIAKEFSEATAQYSHDPMIYAEKMNQLLLHWFVNGVKFGIDYERRTHNALMMTCPSCKFQAPVYHLEWTAAGCPKCDKEFTKEEFGL